MLGSTIPTAFALVAVVAAAAAITLRPASAEPYCPNPAHATPAKVPPDLVPAVAKTFAIDTAIITNGAFVRCVGAKLMACAVGANLVCDKADRRREFARSNRMVSRQSAIRQHPDVRDRTRDDLRMVVQAPTRARGQSYCDRRSARIHRGKLERSANAVMGTTNRAVPLTASPVAAR
jgi:hypothetical protein